MDSKLTLSLNRIIIEQAKVYAKENKVSLSKMIESYLAMVTNRDVTEIEITPLVESLSGVISMDEHKDLKEDYTNFLNEKYK